MNQFQRQPAGDILSTCNDALPAPLSKSLALKPPGIMHGRALGDGSTGGIHCYLPTYTADSWDLRASPREDWMGLGALGARERCGITPGPLWILPGRGLFWSSVEDTANTEVYLEMICRCTTQGGIGRCNIAGRSGDYSTVYCVESGGGPGGGEGSSRGAMLWIARLGAAPSNQTILKLITPPVYSVDTRASCVIADSNIPFPFAAPRDKDRDPEV